MLLLSFAASWAGCRFGRVGAVVFPVFECSSIGVASLVLIVLDWLRLSYYGLGA